MRFTRKELAQAMGLKPGDKIKALGTIFTINDKYILTSSDRDVLSSPAILIDSEFEIVNTIKVGELLCNKIDCESDNCPLNGINCYLDCCLEIKDNPSLYDKLEAWYKEYKDDGIYNILKAKLDQEIK